MKVDIIFLHSEIDDINVLIKEREPLFERLRTFIDINILNFEEFTKSADNKEKDNTVKVVFIGSGGTEGLFTKLFPYLNEPILIIADSICNSLAASFEICSWLNVKRCSYDRIIVPSDINLLNNEIIAREIERIKRTLELKEKLSNYHIGCIGGYSSWLISSHINKETISNSINVNFRDIPINELENKYKEYLNRNIDWESNELYRKYIPYITDDSTPDSLKEAIILFQALKDMVKKYKLNALTVKCFDLLQSCKTTACLALAMLNDNGIVSACEGDMKALLTMIWVKITTNKECFMANPSDVNYTEQTMDFAHCTIPFNMVESYSLPTHFESKIGIGIHGNLPLGEYSIVKLDGFDLNNILCCHGEVIKAPYYPQRCRTQVRFKFASKTDFDNMINNRMGNHVIIVKGRIEQ